MEDYILVKRADLNKVLNDLRDCKEETANSAIESAYQDSISTIYLTVKDFPKLKLSGNVYGSLIARYKTT